MNSCSSCGTQLSLEDNSCSRCAGTSYEVTPSTTSVASSEVSVKPSTVHSEVAEKAGEVTTAIVAKIESGITQMKKSFTNLQTADAQNNHGAENKTILANLTDSGMRVVIIALAGLFLLSNFMPFLTLGLPGDDDSVSINYVYRGDELEPVIPAGVGDGIFIVFAILAVIVLILLEASRVRKGMRIASLVLSITSLLIIFLFAVRINDLAESFGVGKYIHFGVGFWFALLFNIALIVFLSLYVLRFNNSSAQKSDVQNDDK